jgi:hypothetical protein
LGLQALLEHALLTGVGIVVLRSALALQHEDDLPAGKQEEVHG